MSTTILRPVTYGGGMIEYGQPHQCEPGSVANLLISPISSWLSAGFSFVSAGASIYNAFQIQRQTKILNGIERGIQQLQGSIGGIFNSVKDVERKIDVLNRSMSTLHYKMDYLLEGMIHLHELAMQIKMTTEQIKELQSLDIFIHRSIKHFETNFSQRNVDLSAIADLERDFESALGHIKPSTHGKDIQVPRWMISTTEPVARFFRILNLSLIESHNLLVGYDPTRTKSYISSTGSLYLFSSESSAWDPLMQLVNNMNRIDGEKQPNYLWLNAFLWEIMQCRIQLETSTVLNGPKVEIHVPHFSEIDSFVSYKDEIA